MNREDVIADLIKFAAMAYKKDASEISEETDLSDLGVQSMQRVAMSASIEDEYGYPSRSPNSASTSQLANSRTSSLRNPNNRELPGVLMTGRPEAAIRYC